MIKINQVDRIEFSKALIPVYDSALNGQIGTDGIQVVIYGGAIWKALGTKSEMPSVAPVENEFWTQIAGDTGGTSDYYMMPTLGEYGFTGNITLDNNSYFIVTDTDIKFILNGDTSNPNTLVSGASGLRLASADSKLAGVKLSVNGVILPPSALTITQNNGGNAEDKVAVDWSKAFSDSTAQDGDILVIDVPRKIVVTH